MRVLLVEDDPMIGASLVRGLSDHGYAVDWIRDGAQAQSRLLDTEMQFQMVLLDLGLPSIDGLALLAAVRRAGSEIPILVITARGKLDHRVDGLDRGADDYLIKPFEFAELEARMRALSRRCAGRATPQLRTAHLILDPALRAVLKDETVIHLSAKEYAMLHALMVRPGAVLSRSQIESQIYSWCDVIESNAVDFLLHKLRQKIGADQIENVRSMGWRVHT
jgi:two-component system OmpR family response regulator